MHHKRERGGYLKFEVAMWIQEIEENVVDEEENRVETERVTEERGNDTVSPAEGGQTEAEAEGEGDGERPSPLLGFCVIRVSERK